MAASHGQLREYILRKKWDRPAGLAGRFLCWGRTDCHVAVLLAMTGLEVRRVDITDCHTGVRTGSQ